MSIGGNERVRLNGNFSGQNLDQLGKVVSDLAVSAPPAGDRYELADAANPGTRPAATPPVPTPQQEQPKSDIDKDALITLGKLFGEEYDSAFKRLADRKDDLSLKKMSFFELTVRALIEILREKPMQVQRVGAALTKLIVEGNYPVQEKYAIMKVIVDVFNEKDSTVAQKNAILTVFEGARMSTKVDSFGAGLYAVIGLNQEDRDEVSRYILTYKDNVVDETDIAKDKFITQNFYVAVMNYAKAVPTLVGKVVPGLIDGFFQKPQFPQLFRALNLISDVGVIGEKGKEFNVFNFVKANFLQAFKELDPARQGTLSSWVVKHLESPVSFLHVDLINEFIVNFKDTRASVLAALKDLDDASIQPNTDKEKAVVRAYLAFIKLGEEWRTEAITTGVVAHAIQKRIIRQLISDNQKWDDKKMVRDPSHSFITDLKPIHEGKNKMDSPIVLYGIREIPAVESVCDNAATDEIKDQCRATIDKLYTELRKHSWLVDLTPQARITDINAFSGEAFRTYSGNGALTLDFESPEKVNSPWRFLFGFEYQGGKGFNAGGIRLGTSSDLANNALHLKLLGGISGFGIERKDDINPTLPVSVDSATETNYLAHYLTPDITVRGASIYVNPNVDVTIYRWKRGGMTFEFDWSFGARFGLFAAGLTDDGCNYAIDPRKKPYTITPNGDGTYTYVSSGPFDKSCRTNKAVGGYILEGQTGLVLRGMFF